MEPKIISAQEWLVVGMSFYGDPFSQASGWSEDNEIGNLWNRFMAFYMAHNTAIKNIVDPSTMLEIHIETDETEANANFEVFVGVRVAKLEDVPIECVVKVLPATQYAVFTLEGQQIVEDWSKIMQDWITSAGYRRAHRFGFQYYDERFKGLENIEASTLDAYVPVEKIA